MLRPTEFERHLRQAVSPAEALHSERIVARSRTLLAFMAMLAIYIDPTEPSRHAVLAYSLLLGYTAYSVVALAWQHRARDPSPRLWTLVHAIDIAWASGITLFTDGPNSPFFLFFIFVLLAAAYRWGFLETVASALIIGVLLCAEAALLTYRPWGIGQILEGEFEVNRFVLRAAYLLIAGVLLGYLAESEKRLRAENALITRLVGAVQSEGRLAATMQKLAGEVLELFGATQALLAAEEPGGERAFLWTFERPVQKAEVRFHVAELTPAQRETYLFPAPATAAFAVDGQVAGDVRLRVVSLDDSSRKVHRPPMALPEGFGEVHRFQRLLFSSHNYGNEWGRLFLLDPAPGADGESEMRFLETLVRQAGSAICGVYVLRRLRSKISALERARAARELHDGVIQSLFSLQLQIAVLQRRAESEAPAMVEALTAAQEVVHQEVINLRDLMQKLRPLEVHPNHLLSMLAETAERFQRESGVITTFVPTVEEIDLPAKVCTELVRIVQEALTNVRKHAAARHVRIGLTAVNGALRLVVDDDGRGFSFSGRLSQAQLDHMRRGPLVIKERVQAMGGELEVESDPGCGSRLAITVPRKTHA